MKPQADTTSGDDFVEVAGVRPVVARFQPIALPVTSKLPDIHTI